MFGYAYCNSDSPLRHVGAGRRHGRTPAALAAAGDRAPGRPGPSNSASIEGKWWPWRLSSPPARIARTSRSCWGPYRANMRCAACRCWNARSTTTRNRPWRSFSSSFSRRSRWAGPIAPPRWRTYSARSWTRGRFTCRTWCSWTAAASYRRSYPGESDFMKDPATNIRAELEKLLKPR